MDTKKKIGYRIVESLNRRGMKQKDLAKELGVTDNTVSYYCSGSRSPQLSQLAQIAKILNTTTDYLLGLTDDYEIHPSAIDDLGLSNAAIQQLRQVKDGKHKISKSGTIAIIDQVLKSFDAIFLFSFFSDYAFFAKGQGMYDTLLEKWSSEGDSDDFNYLEEKMRSYVSMKYCPDELKAYVDADNWIISQTHNHNENRIMRTAFREMGSFDMKEFYEYRLNEVFSLITKDIWNEAYNDGQQNTELANQ